MVTRTRKRGFELTCRAGLYVHLSYPVVHMIRRTAFVAQICESKEMCHGPFGTETLKCVCAMVSIKACSAKDMALANLAREFDAEKVSGLCSGVTKCVCARAAVVPCSTHHRAKGRGVACDNDRWCAHIDRHVAIALINTPTPGAGTRGGARCRGSNQISSRHGKGIDTSENGGRSRHRAYGAAVTEFYT